MSTKTLLIGLDGATFTVLDPLMKDGHMPFLQSFFGSGVRAPLRTIVPALTPPAWTSLVTGRRPGQHGIFDFFRMESRDNLHLRFHTSNDIQCDTLWSLATREGLRVTALNFPGMFPAPRVSGYVIPGWVPWKQLRLACWPEELFDDVKRDIPGFNAKELAMDIGLEEKATEGCSSEEEYAPWIELHTRREENWFRIFEYLHRKDPSDLTAVLFDGVDKLQHLCWRFLLPEYEAALTPPWELRARQLCIEYFRRLDTILQRMCECVGPDASVIVASDHGFQSSSEVFHINAWLAEKGYLQWSDQAGDTSSKALLGVSQVARHTWQLDWTATTAFAATPTSNGIYIIQKREGKSHGIDPADYEAVRSRLIRELEAFRHPNTGHKVVSKVWTREEIFAGPHGDVAPDLTLELVDGGLVSILPSQNLISRRPAVSGVHAPAGVFGASGPAFAKGLRSGQISILDVAPILLRSLGIRIPQELEGSLPESIYRAGLPAGRGSPVRSMAAAAPASSPVPSPTLSAEDEQMLLDRLRQLGYLE